MDLSQKRIMLTGGAGFLGSFVTAKLKARGCKEIFIPKEQDYDLTKPAAIEAAFKASKPDVVIHLAASAYPKFAPIPFKEEDLRNGYPEETNAPYGLVELIARLTGFKGNLTCRPFVPQYCP
ncbi:MAG: NAD-dependent epimerase/dehydratase family protein [Elusimicrobiota bacterium]|nr:NAD-dependent epimerase/dehydratase family protein [Elusimicrobiota bacterium]